MGNLFSSPAPPKQSVRGYPASSNYIFSSNYPVQSFATTTTYVTTHTPPQRLPNVVPTAPRNYPVQSYSTTTPSPTAPRLPQTVNPPSWDLPVPGYSTVVTTSKDPEHSRNYAVQPSPSTATTNTGVSTAWKIFELLAQMVNIDLRSATNIVNLFEEGNTIPFICRYRSDKIRSDIGPEKMRHIKAAYNQILAVREKADTIIAQMEDDCLITEPIRRQMLCAKSEDELDFLYAPYKPAEKGSLADRAKANGLEKYADYLQSGNRPPLKLETIVDYTNEEINTKDKVADGISHILSHNFIKNTKILEMSKKWQKVQGVILKCSKIQKTSEKEDKKPNIKKDPKHDESNFEIYFNYKNQVRQLKPHQVLAINRAEKLNFLSVTIIFPNTLKTEVKFFVRKIFFSQGSSYPQRMEIFEKAYEDFYTNQIQSLLIRQIRSELTEMAEKASIEVFAKNLKQLLLMSPLKGERILGIDPGFYNGCKIAIISETADVLETGVVYPHTRSSNPISCGKQLARLLAKHDCKLIALGNGQGCRETELWIAQLFKEGVLDQTSIKYSIVSEQGASIYSCSDVARKEFPNMDLNHISAVSIARRLNDPLCEYVKIEPRHIGVGMYQHDVNENFLSESLNEVVSECVSFVGVDINTASLSLLKHIAGFTELRAEKIIEYRLRKGPFRSRQDLLNVQYIDKNAFTQCAGFIRIDPRTVGGAMTNLLDCTWVHPESYDIANKIICQCDIRLKDIGQPQFIRKITGFSKRTTLDQLEKDFKVPKERIKFVIEALRRELYKDYRSDFDKKPLFKQALTQMSDLKKGVSVTGAVTNITHFGAFVDIGIGQDALIHSSKMKKRSLNIGDRVEASVLDVDMERERVQLKLEEVI